MAEAAIGNATDGAGWLAIQVDHTSYAERLGGLEPLALGTDDPLLFGADLTEQYEIARWIGCPDEPLGAALDRGLDGAGGGTAAAGRRGQLARSGLSQ